MNCFNNQWRFIADPPLSAEKNMAIDEAIAVSFSEGKVPPTLRLYQWESPTLTLGSFQKIDSDLLRRLEETPIPFVRRITGGRAILHDQEITYSVIGSTTDPLFIGGLKKTFYAISKGLLAGLNNLGINAEIYAPDRKSNCCQPNSPFCMESLSWYEIAVAGKKLIGSAQKRWPHSFLQHGSLPLQSRFSNFSIASLSLSDLLPKIPLPSEINEAIRVGFETALQIELKATDRLTPEEMEKVDQLVVEKYGNLYWNQDRKI